MSYEHDEATQTDALGAIRTQLVSAARRRRTRQRRKRTFAVAATAFALLSTSAGALSITGGATGIEPIDRWLNLAAGSSDDARRGQSDQPRPGPSGPSGGVSQPVVVPLGGERQGIGVGYGADGQTLCTVLAETHAVARLPRGTAACVGLNVMVEALKSDPALKVGTSAIRPASGGGPVSVVQGLTRADVRNLTVVTPTEGRVDAVLSDQWMPSGASGPLRIFFAAVADRSREVGGTPPVIESFLEARLDSGRIVTIRP